MGSLLSCELNRVIPPESLASLRQQLGDTPIILTAGVFALLHLGHLMLLEAMAQELPTGKVVVALHSDDGIRRYRTDVPAWLPLHERQVLLASLRVVDFVTFYDTPTPAPVINALRPAVYAKGRDYNWRKLPLPEREACEAVEARVLFLTPKVRSSRALIDWFTRAVSVRNVE